MLYYFSPHHGNFGDDLNPWLWPRLAPEVCGAQKPALFLGIGTILNRSVPVEPLKIVFGSGCSSGRPPEIDRTWFFYCVRGPLTAAKLNLPPEFSIADPAILSKGFAAAEERKQFSVSFMPHHQSLLHADWKNLCAREDIHCIDPRFGVEKTLWEIQQTKLLLTEALHGAIVADALRVPWIPVRLYGNFTEFKWLDFAQSINVALKINDVSPVYSEKFLSQKGITHAFKKTLFHAGLGKEKWKRLTLRASSERDIGQTLRALGALAKTQRPFLSSDKIIRELEERLLERLDALRQDWRHGKFEN